MKQKKVSRNNIYGVSSIYQCGTWHHAVYKITSDEQAQDFLKTETYNFADHEIMSKTAALKLAGKKAVDNAVYFAEEYYFAY